MTNLLFCYGLMVVVACGLSQAQPLSPEQSRRQEIAIRMEEVLSVGRDTWIEEMQAIKNENSISFEGCLRDVLKNRRLKTVLRSSGKSKYMGLNDPVLERAVVYSIRKEPGSPALSNALGNLLSLEAEGKTVKPAREGVIAEELLAAGDFSPRGTLARVLKHFSVKLRLGIYQDLLTGCESGTLTAEKALQLLGPAYVREEDPALKQQLAEILRRIGSSPEDQAALAEEAAKVKDKPLEQAENSAPSATQQSPISQDQQGAGVSSNSKTEPLVRGDVPSDSVDRGQRRWIQMGLIVAGSLAFLAAIRLMRS